MNGAVPPLKILLVGGGNRAIKYARYLEQFPEKAVIVGVAEPRPEQRAYFRSRYDLSEEVLSESWEPFAQREKWADAVIITTPDALHVAPVEAFAARGYGILVEKPMATNEADCHRVLRAVKENRIVFAVCHVLRYTPYTLQMTALIRAGTIGSVRSVQHIEPVGYWHQAHSFVRGNWRNSDETCCMILSKSCHDTDWIRLIVDSPCTCVSSFGGLRHFTPECRPPGAADYCSDCPAHVESACPYSARRLYFDFFNRGYYPGWPVDIVAFQPNAVELAEALRTGPYGRCVYACDNNVVDHQVVNMQFQNGAMASFLMTAFSPAESRRSVICGTHGMIVGDSSRIRVHDFLTDTVREIPIQTDPAYGGHHGGDGGVIAHFLQALAEKNPDAVSSGADVSLETHRIAFAAEISRLRRGLPVSLLSFDL